MKLGIRPVTARSVGNRFVTIAAKLGILAVNAQSHQKKSPAISAVKWAIFPESAPLEVVVEVEVVEVVVVEEVVGQATALQVMLSVTSVARLVTSLVTALQRGVRATVVVVVVDLVDHMV